MELLSIIFLTKVTAIGMIIQHVQSNENNIHDPPNSAKSGCNQLQDTKENVSKIESINAYFTYGLISNSRKSFPNIINIILTDTHTRTHTHNTISVPFSPGHSQLNRKDKRVKERKIFTEWTKKDRKK